MSCQVKHPLTQNVSCNWFSNTMVNGKTEGVAVCLYAFVFVLFCSFLVVVVFCFVFCFVFVFCLVFETHSMLIS